jgi:hypothetical protein
MKNYLAAAIMIASLVPATGAMAANELILLTHDELRNRAVISMDGNANRLEITQEHTGGIGSNSITATINGDFNGGSPNAVFSGAALFTGLKPGTLTQSGHDNAMTIAVNGSSNLFAFAQNGSGNSLVASITGIGNQAAVVQTGVNNHAGFSQNGIGNIVSITQQSW